MDPLGKKELLYFYNRHLKDFGDAPQAVRWTPEGQRRRYETLLRIAGDISGKKILDFGCGKGDLYGFIKERGISINYCGIDVNENLIKLAKSKYPETEFIAVDLEESEFERAFDVIFICGVFNLRIAGIEESMKNVLKTLFRLCKETLHVNFLSYYIAQRNVELFYVKPEEILKFAITELSPSVKLMNDKEDIFLSVYRS
jgi:2-polyprenyl-3-methyl-5-hydroxy-6-metoxy-1,4-benzoquinol methylase